MKHLKVKKKKPVEVPQINDTAAEGQENSKVKAPAAQDSDTFETGRAAIGGNSQSGRGKRLKQLRVECGLTQQQVADAAGLARGTYIRLENDTEINHHPGTFEKFEKLAEVLRTTPEYIKYGITQQAQTQQEQTNADRILCVMESLMKLKSDTVTLTKIEEYIKAQMKLAELEKAYELEMAAIKERI